VGSVCLVQKMVLDFKCPVDEAQNFLRKAKASQKKEDFLEVENILRPDRSSDLSLMDHEELEIYLQASLHYAVLLLQEMDEENDGDYSKILSRAKELLQFDPINPHGLWIEGMCRLKQNDVDGVESLKTALRRAIRMGLVEVPQWQAELSRIEKHIAEQQAKMGVGSSTQTNNTAASSSSRPKIEELDNDNENETPGLQKGFFNTKKKEQGKELNGKAPSSNNNTKNSNNLGVVKEPECGSRERKSDSSSGAIPGPANGGAVQNALNQFRELLLETEGNHKKLFEDEAKIRAEAEKSRKEDHGDMLQLLEEKMDAVPEAMESIKSKAEDFGEILEQLQNQVQRTNVESISLKQDAHEVLQESKKQRIACEEAQARITAFVKEGQDMIRSSKQNNVVEKQDSTATSVKIVEIEVSAFKQPKVWIAITGSFVAGLLMMLGVLVEVYGAWGCEFTCRAR